MTELKTLNELRLENGWTFQEIADAITALGYPIQMGTVQRVLRHPDRAPRETTLFKIRKYLAVLEQTDARTEKPKGRSTVARRPALIGDAARTV